MKLITYPWNASYKALLTTRAQRRARTPFVDRGPEPCIRTVGQYGILRLLMIWLSCAGLPGLLSQPANAQSTAGVQVIHAFTGDDGRFPVSSLVQNGDGYFFGTTAWGGLNDKGTIFKVTSAGALTSLHSFSGSDGQDPWAALTLGTDGDFYGTSLQGGVNDVGTVFKSTPTGAVTVLHTFSGSEQANPSGLELASDGSFYGTVMNGGTNSDGYVYKITSTGTKTDPHNFSGSDGSSPGGGVILGNDGYFYGTTTLGGTSNDGTVFKMTSTGVLTVLHSFSGSDGESVVGQGPGGGLIQSSDGNFYGVTSAGGVYGDGTIFRITPTGLLTNLYSFSGSDGKTPNASLIQGSDGNFYGTTASGGHYDEGTVFQITPTGTLTLLYSFSGFSGAGIYGAYPESGLIEDSDGNFYGTTAYGGVSGGNGNGVIYKMTVLAAPTQLTATAGAGQITLSWGAVSGATSYNVYQGSATGGESATPVNAGLVSNTITLTGLTNGTAYYFKVAAVNASAPPAFSTEVSAIPAAAPAQVAALAATPGNGEVTLNWATDSGATSYSVYEGTTPGGEIPLQTGWTTTGFVATGLTNGTTYYFEVAGVNGSGTGVRSSEVAATPLGGIVATPGFSPSAGIYTSAQKVTIYDLTAGAAIYYTTDGSTPSAASTLYTHPITVARSKTLKAAALVNGDANSSVATAIYTISRP